MFGAPGTYFSTLAKLFNFWRNTDHPKTICKTWERRFGAEAALRYAGNKPPRCISNRWGSVHACEAFIVAPPPDMLTKVITEVLVWKTSYWGEPIPAELLSITWGQEYFKAPVTDNIVGAIVVPVPAVPAVGGGRARGRGRGGRGRGRASASSIKDGAPEIQSAIESSAVAPRLEDSEGLSIETYTVFKKREGQWAADIYRMVMGPGFLFLAHACFKCRGPLMHALNSLSPDPIAFRKKYGHGPTPLSIFVTSGASAMMRLSSLKTSDFRSWISICFVC